jgi:hypothetical protein
MDAGDNVAALREARALAASDDKAVVAAAARITTALRPDRVTLMSAAGLLLFLAVLAFGATHRHDTVREASHVLEGIEAGDADGARAGFTEQGWADGGGKELYDGFQGRPGRAFELSERAEDAGFVMIEFRGDGGTWTDRRYLMFEELPDGPRARRVRFKRPRAPAAN